MLNAERPISLKRKDKIQKGNGITGKERGFKPSELINNVLETTASFLATGLNPEKSIIFNQSSVSGHSELAWILNCVSRIGWLNRMTQFKDKAGSDKEKASVGLYIYPNLMAADILLYKATHVPVGADQKQHLELSRDIAQKFNNDFNCENFFPLPEPLISKNISRVMSLRDGTKKMSKSEESDYSRINLKDSSDEIVKKIKFNNDILHQSKLINYFNGDYSKTKIEKDVNNFLKKIKKNKKYFFSKKDVIFIESLKSDGIKIDEKYNDLYQLNMSEIPSDMQVMINNDEKGAALLRIAEVIGPDELDRIDEDTMYFIISTLNQLNINFLRNKILLQVLPLKV